jgi:hypothetical protein
MSIDREPLLRTLSGPLRKLIRQRYKSDSCIASARIAIDVLTQLDIKAEPLAVDAMIFNREFVALMDQHGRLPESVAEREEWVADTGAHSVGIGVPTDTSEGLHMVVIVEDHWLWDLAIDQAARPERGIILDRPILAPVTPEFLAAEQPVAGRNAEGVLIVYRARPNYEPWLISPNWRADGHDAPDRQRMVELTLRAIVQAAKAALQTA